MTGVALGPALLGLSSGSLKQHVDNQICTVNRWRTSFDALVAQFPMHIGLRLPLVARAAGAMPCRIASHYHFWRLSSRDALTLKHANGNSHRNDCIHANSFRAFSLASVCVRNRLIYADRFDHSSPLRPP